MPPRRMKDDVLWGYPQIFEQYLSNFKKIDPNKDPADDHEQSQIFKINIDAELIQSILSYSPEFKNILIKIRDFSQFLEEEVLSIAGLNPAESLRSQLETNHPDLLKLLDQRKDELIQLISKEIVTIQDKLEEASLGIRGAAEKEALEKEKEILLSFFALFSSAVSLEELLQNAQEEATTPSVAPPVDNVDNLAVPEKLIPQSYQLFYLFIQDIRGPKGFGDFLNFPELEFDEVDPLGAEKTMIFFRETFSDKISTDEKERRIIKIAQDIEKVVILIDKSLLDVNTSSTSKIKFPNAPWSAGSEWFSVTGDFEQNPDKTFKGYLQRWPVEVRPFFKAQLGLHIMLAVAHTGAALYEQARPSQGKVSAQTLQGIISRKEADSHPFGDVLTEDGLSGMFGGAERYKDELGEYLPFLFGKSGDFSHLVQISMGTWLKGEKGLSDSDPKPGKNIESDIPYAQKDPDPFYDKMVTYVEGHYLRWLEEVGRIQSGGQLTTEDKIIVDLAIRYAFIYHRILLNEPKEDEKAIEQVISQYLNSDKYYSPEKGSKSITDPSSGKKMAIDTAVVSEHVIPLSEYSRGLVVLPREAVIIVPWSEFIKELREVYSTKTNKNISGVKDMELIRAFPGVFRIFTDKALFGSNINAPNGPKFRDDIDVLQAKFSVVKIDPKYRVLHKPNEKGMDFAILMTETIQPVRDPATEGQMLKTDLPRIALDVTINELLSHLQVAPQYQDEQGIIHTAVDFGTFTNDAVGNFARLLNQSIILHNMADINEPEKHLKHLERMRKNISVRRKGGRDQLVDLISLEVKTRKYYALGYIQRSILGKPPALEYSSLDPLARQRLDDQERQEAEQLSKEIVESMLKVREMLIVHPDEIGPTEYKETLGMADVFEQAVKYLWTGLGASSSRKIVDPRTNIIRPREDDDSPGIAPLYRMFRDIGEKMDEPHIFFSKELNDWVNEIRVTNYLATQPEHASDKAQNILKERRRRASDAILIEIAMVVVLYYLNRYILTPFRAKERPDLHNLQSFDVVNVETVSGVGVLTPDYQILAEEVFAMYFTDLIIKSLAPNAGEARDLLESNYGRKQIKRRVLDICARLGIIGSMESAWIMYKWMKAGGLRSLPAATATDPLNSSNQQLIENVKSLVPRS